MLSFISSLIQNELYCSFENHSSRAGSYMGSVFCKGISVMVLIRTCVTVGKDPYVQPRTLATAVGLDPQ